MSVFKRVSLFLANFLKSYVIIAILLIITILLLSGCSPKIFSVFNKNKNNSDNVTSESNFENSGPSVFVYGDNSQVSSTDEVSSVISDVHSSKAQKTGSVSSKTKSNKGSKESSSQISSQKQKTVEKIRVICWGDSITQGMSVPSDKNYPAVLNAYLGDEYEVLNAGVPGESSYAIAARQGAIEAFTARDVVIKKGKLNAYLGKKGDTGICMSNGKNIDIDDRGYAFNCQLPATVIYIGGVKYRLSVSNGEFYISTYSKAEKDIKIKKGSKIEFNCSREQQKAYCEVILIGANDGLGGSSEDIQSLTERYKKMAERRKNGKYLVIVPYWLGDLFDKVFVEVFGDKAINFRETARTTGLTMVGIHQPTAHDEFRLKNGLIPLTFMLDDNDVLHLSETGYKLLGTLIYQRGLKLKYW